MSKPKRIRLKVASPCNADWEAMSGDEAIRHCGLCNKNVYQISNMSSEQVEELLAESGEKKCGRFYQRADGTLVTADCSVGLKRKRRKQAIIGVGAGLVSAIGLAMGSAGSAPPNQAPHGASTVIEVEPSHIVIMGDVGIAPDEEFDQVEEEAASEKIDVDVERPRIIMGRLRRAPDIDLD